MTPAEESWMKFLNPESLRANLMVSSLYLAAYETLKKTIIEEIQSFYTLGLPRSDDPVAHESYRKEVLALDKRALRASALWLQKMEVIDANDVAALDKIREHRDAIAHHLPEFVCDVQFNVDTELFQRMVELLWKIDRWWIMEVHVPTNPAFDHKEVNPDTVQSGNMIFLQMLVQIATGAGGDPSYYYNEVKKRFSKAT